MHACVYFFRVNHYIYSFIQNGATPLIVAASLGNEETVDLLLKRGANIEASDTWVSVVILVKSICQ